MKHITALEFAFYWTLQITKTRTTNHSPWQWFSYFLLMQSCESGADQSFLTPEKPLAQQSASGSGEQHLAPNTIQWIKHLTRKSSLSKFFHWHRKQYCLPPTVVVRGKWLDSCKAHSSVLTLTLLCLPSHSTGEFCKTILSIFQQFFKCEWSQQPSCRISSSYIVIYPVWKWEISPKGNL